MATSSSAVIQRLLPDLAAGLGEVRRSPGRGVGWMEEVLRALEQDYPARYDRLRRRLGFARRLGDLAVLDVTDRAVISVALFFHELLPESTEGEGSKAARPWHEYLLRNEEWLAPCFELTECLRSAQWEDCASRPAVVAKIAIAFDAETLEHHGRPLQVLSSLLAEVQTPAAQEILPLLWSEEGQELCDHHFRRHPKAYKLDSRDLKQQIELLSRGAPRRAAEEAAVAPLRLSAAAIKTKERSMPEKEKRPQQTQERPPAADNFERRRQLLRSRNALGQAGTAAPVETAPEPKDSPETPLTTQPESAPDADGGAGADLWLPNTHAATAPEAESVPQAPEPPSILRRRQEEKMDTARTLASVRRDRGDNEDLLGKLDELRQQFDRIQQLATEGQRLATELAPKLEEFTSWVGDLESILHRGKGRDAS